MNYEQKKLSHKAERLIERLQEIQKKKIELLQELKKSIEYERIKKRWIV